MINKESEITQEQSKYISERMRYMMDLCNSSGLTHEEKSPILVEEIKKFKAFHADNNMPLPESMFSGGDEENVTLLFLVAEITKKSNFNELIERCANDDMSFQKSKLYG